MLFCFTVYLLYYHFTYSTTNSVMTYIRSKPQIPMTTKRKRNYNTTKHNVKIKKCSVGIKMCIEQRSVLRKRHKTAVLQYCTG